MKIHGRRIHSDNPINLPVAIITSGHKQIAIAVIVADFATDTVCEQGQACINLLAVAAYANKLTGRLHKVELAHNPSVTARVQMIVTLANNGDNIVFMCANTAIFDIAWHALNVRKIS